MRSAQTWPRELGALDYPKRKGLLSALAREMILQGLSAIHENDVDEIFRAQLADYALEELDPTDVRRALVERSGLLQESSEASLEFLHNTLKEYLAAERFANQDEYAVLAKNCEEESWQPVLLFAVALPRDGSSFSTHLVKGVLEKTPLESTPVSRKKSDKAKAAAVRAKQFFFIRCAMAAYQVKDERAREALQTISARLLPPKGLTEAEVLASCGDDLAPYLTRKEEQSASVRAACVPGVGVDRYSTSGTSALRVHA